MAFWLSDPEPELRLRVRRPRFFWVVPAAIFACVCILIGGLVYDEMRTSREQAKYLSWYDRRISFDMQTDANSDIRFPKFGPYNERLGYSYMPFFIKALQADDFTVAAQMRASPVYTILYVVGSTPSIDLKQ